MHEAGCTHSSARFGLRGASWICLSTLAMLSCPGGCRYWWWRTARRPQTGDWTVQSF